MLQIKNLSIDLGEFKLKEINLEINENEYFVILGPTGAGKTILLESIAGIYSIDEGFIFLNNRDITNMSPKDRNIGIVYQDFMLFPHLKIEKNIGFGLKIQGYSKDEIKEKVDEVLELLNITHLRERYPGTLSGGEQQKTSIARALVTEPEMLLLDEPLGSLDPPTRKELNDELRLIHRETGIKTLHVTHNYEEAMFLGDRIAILNAGEIIQIGKPMDVFDKPKSEFIANFVMTRNIFKAESKLKGKIYEAKFDSTTIEAVNGKEGDVQVCIRPEEILVSKGPIRSSGRNSIHGKISDISHLGALVNLTVDAGFDIVASITEGSLDDLGLKIGSEVYLTFKATSVHMI
jgi:molybdate transport system ATP-binding protein/molybdate/tungstate transport system ATP-binding protein